MIKDFFLYTLKNLKTRGLRSWLTIFGIFIGIAAVVSLISLGQGLESAINEEFASLGTDKLIITAKAAEFAPPGAFTVTPLTRKDIEPIEKVSGVKQAISRIFQPAEVEYNNELKYLYVINMPVDETQKNILDLDKINIEKGRMLKKGDKYKILIGYDIAYENIFDRNIRLRDKVIINKQEFEVIGILEKNSETNNNIFVEENTLIELLAMKEEEINLILIQSKPGVNLEKLEEDIIKEFRKFRNQEKGKENFEIQTPKDIAESFSKILNIVQVVLIGIAAISLFIGGIGIMNTMYTSVLERTKEIGIMKAIGATNKDILSIFLIESGLLGLIGGIIGIILGIIIGKSVELIAAQTLGTNLLQTSFPWYLISGALAFSFLIGTISGSLPAIKASKLKPVDALKYE
ncbi:ABC transporter permease [Candidatus Woesearchaeota archaeon]|nr:ABC transporter permease [Candidatus Woesearchaeota archaeon]